MRKIIFSLWLTPRQCAMFLIAIYQHTLSPDHGFVRHFFPYGFCRHEPTCSERSMRYFKEEGFFIGTLKMIKQISSCHPWKKLSDKKLKMMIDK